MIIIDGLIRNSDTEQDSAAWVVKARMMTTHDMKINLTLHISLFFSVEVLN